MNELPAGAVAVWSAENCGPLEVAVTGKQMTLLVRARATAGQWRGTLLARAGDEPHARLLYCTEINPKHIGDRERRRLKDLTAVEFLWRTDPLEQRVVPEYFAPDSPYDWKLSREHPDCRAGLLRVAAPVDWIGRDGWHEFVVRFNGPNLELFVDGVLVDEEWPHGELRHFTGPFVVGPDFSGEIAHVAIWDRALTDAEIGRGPAAGGPVAGSLQYWRPPGYNQFVGDCMPFFHDGTLHFFYLADRRHHQSKWATGAHQFGHLSTRDLVHWTQHPLALAITAQAEGSLGTGNCYFHDGTYYLYWIAHSRRLPFVDARDHEDNIYVATSTDGIHFTKQPGPWLRLGYQTGGDINPFVFWDAVNRRHLMVIGGDAKHLAGIQRFESTDLKTWRKSDALPSVSHLGVCPSYLEWNGWHYVASWSLPLAYWLSNEPPAHDRFRLAPVGLDETVVVPMLVPFTGNRALLVGFRCYQDGYASQAVFRELVQHPDGTLTTKWVPEMIPPTGPPLAVAGKLRVENGAASLANLPRACRISCRVVPDPGASGFGIGLRANAEFTSGYELRFVPEQQALEMRDTPGGAPRRPHTINNQPEVITGLDRPFDLDIIVKEDFFDLCLDNRLTKIHPLLAGGDHLLFFCGRGGVTFEKILVRPLERS